MTITGRAAACLIAVISWTSSGQQLHSGESGAAEDAYRRGEYHQAEAAWRALLAHTAQSDLGNRTSLELNLATVLRAEARYDEAEQLYRNVVRTREQVAGSDSRSLPAALRGLALVDVAKGRLDDAARLIDRIREIGTRTAAGDGERGETEVVAATVLFRAGAFHPARSHAGEALRLLEDAPGDSAQWRIEALNLLGLIEKSQSHYRAAEQYYSRALELLAETGAGSHPDLAVVWNNLGQVKAAEGQAKAAKALFEHAIGLWREIYGPEHPDLASGLTNLAMIYSGRRRYAEAEALLQQALQIHEKAGGSDLRVALDWNELGVVKMRERQFCAAEVLFRRALDVYERTVGPDHPDTGQELTNLALSCVAQKRYADAAPLLARAVAIRERRFGAQDRELGALLATYSRVLRINQDYAGAAQAEARAMRVKIQSLIHGNTQ